MAPLPFSLPPLASAPALIAYAKTLPCRHFRGMNLKAGLQVNQKEGLQVYQQNPSFHWLETWLETILNHYIIFKNHLKKYWMSQHQIKFDISVCVYINIYTQIYNIYIQFCLILWGVLLGRSRTSQVNSQGVPRVFGPNWIRNAEAKA